MKILLLTVFILFSSNTYEQVGKSINKEDLEKVEQAIIEGRLEHIRNLKFSVELLEEYLILVNIPYSNYMTKQAYLETGEFKSAIFIENNNLFGMKHPKVRPTTSLGTNRGHAVYYHWTESVDDYILWLRYYKDRGYNTEDYFKFLKEVGYAEDPHYIYKLQNLNYV